MNYNKEMTSTMIARYCSAPNRETVAILARQFGKSEKSIIGKLSKEGVYQRAVYVTKTGEKPITKTELVAKLEDKYEIDLKGLEKSPKEVLKRLVEVLCVD